ncbi:uncharacterized protein LOC144450160 [Glandiceps talaboti]
MALRATYTFVKLAFILSSGILLEIDAQELGIVDGSFIITDPSTYTIDIGNEVEIIFSIGLTSTFAESQDVLISLYLSDDTSLTTASDSFFVFSSEITSDGHLSQITVAANADGSTPTTGLMAHVTADAGQCTSYRYLCVYLDPFDDIACVDISSNIDCKVLGIKDGSFIVTVPSPYTLGVRDYVEITFSIGITNDNTDAVSATDIYLTIHDSMVFGNDVFVEKFPVGPSSSFPSTVNANTDGTTPTTGLTSWIIINNFECQEYVDIFICARVYPGSDTECIDVTSNVECPDVSFSGLPVIATGPDDVTFSPTTPVTISFDAGLVNSLSTEVSITSYKMYFFIYDVSDPYGRKTSDPIDVTGAPTTVPANADGTAGNGLTTGMTATLLVKEHNCDESHMPCLQIEPGYSSTCLLPIDYWLLPFPCNLNGIGLKDGTFLITSPATYTFSSDSAVEITFQAGFQMSVLAESEIQITSVGLYFSDNVDLSATGAKVSDAIPVNWAPTVVTLGADGTANNGLATGMTGLVQIFNADDCSYYYLFCLKVQPSAATLCIDITGKIECTVDNGASSTTVSVLTMIGVSIIAMVTGDI